MVPASFRNVRTSGSKTGWTSSRSLVPLLANSDLMQLRFGDALNGLAVERFGLAAEQLVLHVKSVAVTLPIQRMSREDKLRAMEALWEDLSRDDVEINSPAWHAEALRETERLIREGKAKFSDWQTAKRRVRQKALRMK